MRLKRVEIQGYKSFATKTVFDFEGGITAIVGPNGSGKSNIMDALRWVMGETATSQMRAKKLEDVIFSGSESRAPAGLAEVRIVLDNSENWLPLEFTEVAVTRRVHRSGDSEFLINDNRVRLRDIQELFTSSGLGQESYALLGQGLVEEVLRLKPEERRALIEEVADVRRHRVKLAEARRKREQAHENLERARLLVEEIEPRLRRLERQAKRALQHAELKTELREVLGLFYRREWRLLQDELNERRAAHDRRAVEQAAAALAVEQAEETLSTWESELTLVRTTLEQTSAQQRERADRLRELEHELAMAQQREGLLRQRARELGADLKRLDARLQPVRAQEPGPETGQSSDTPADPLGEQTDEEQAAAARAASDQAETALREAESHLVALQRSEREIDRQLDESAKAEAEDERRSDGLTRERGTLEAAATDRQAGLTARRDAVHSAEQAAAGAGTAAGEAGSEARAARETREQLSQRFYAAGAYLRGLEASRAERDRRLVRARDRLAMLRELQAESEGIHQGLRALFGSKGVPRGGEETGIPGVIGVVRHLVRAPAGLEHAIEAALEDYLDAVVYESADEALQTVQVLLSERAGRIVALPIDTLKPRAALAMPPEKGVIGVASALVRCDDAHRAWVDTLLGRTLVVEDAEAARTMLRRGLGNAVTRDGSLFRANGTLAGGRQAEQGAFARETELQSLPDQIEQLERSLAETADVEGKREELESIERELRAAEEESEAAAVRRAAAQDESAARRADVTRLTAELRGLESDAHRDAHRLEEIVAAQNAIMAAGQRRLAERTESEARRSSAELLETAEQARESAADQATRAALHKREAEAEHEALRAARVERETAQAEARAQREEQASQLGEVETELASLTTELSRISEALLPARAAVDDVAADERPEAQAVARLQALEGEQRGSVQRSQHGLIVAERNLVTAEAAVNESDRGLAHLEEQMQADEFDTGAMGFVTGSGAAREGAPREGPESVAGTVVSMISAAGLGATHEPPHDSAHGGGGAAAESGSAGRGTAPASAAGNGNATGTGSGNGSSGPVEQASGDALPDERREPEETLTELRERIEALRGRLRWLGNVNPDAAAEYQEIEERHTFLSGEIADLEGAEQRMLQAEADLGELIEGAFSEAFESVDRHFRRYFRTMFRGGTGRLTLTTPEEGEPGVDIFAQPPGKRVGNLRMLSGGERSLTAMALLFAMLEVNPAPFSVLDEVDAALDEANVVRFVDGLKELARGSQFVVITHNRRTIEQADNIYGITMGDDSVSRVLSVRLRDLELED